MSEISNSKNIQDLLQELNDKQQELVQKAKECGDDSVLYDFTFIIRKRTVCMKSNNSLYVEFSFNKSNFEEKFNNKIKRIQKQLKMMSINNSAKN
ncbi:hypothetical protein [Poseidonibacter ostreae]|uniref:Uncharacterized protein n=1 Tax=Poseidonibacter ostreae TaxID=2654171 RepID=A0A6L4WWV2_9BACT|nr:hypothetical protein [Poseidonibacter ostreae]KAB7891357.1 hypothetical protein GBG19_00545 [Poseidonibacter ostreae]